MALHTTSKAAYIVILNWNGWSDTLGCVASCRKLTYPRFRILVVDNGSTDGSEQRLRERLDDVEILQAGANLGFSGGNNVGIRHALDSGTEYVWLLNNDTTVDPDTLSELVRTMEADPKIGIVGSKILTAADPDTLHFAGGTVNLSSGDTHHIGAWEKDRGQYEHISDVDYATACSMLTKRAVIDKIGLMPEEYFLYYEETDWCLRARRAGYRTCMAQSSRVFHKVSASISYDSPEKLYYLTRNRLYFLNKYGSHIKWLERVATDARKFLYLARTGRIKKGIMILNAYRHWLSNTRGPIK